MCKCELIFILTVELYFISNKHKNDQREPNTKKDTRGVVAHSIKIILLEFFPSSYTNFLDVINSWK